ncbi:MAG: hypothetical protein K5634_00030 [Sphaerochaetaceae bacterium]|nr:hypothetical protein [Sphaerochaetaceae bacterium]
MFSTQYLLNLVYLFFIYSFAGWCIEVIGKLFQYHRFINRGFLLGPWIPIYGAGCLLITVSNQALANLSYMNQSYGSVFAVSFLLCGVLEYLTSFFMEKLFHARWWDYSQRPMNLNGRVWIGNLVLFGVAGVLVVKLLNPVIFSLIDRIPWNIKLIVAAVLVCMFIADFIFSVFVLKMIKAGIESSKADKTEDISREIRALMADKSLFVRRFAEAYPDVIYLTDRVKERMEKVRQQTEAFRKEAEQRLVSAPVRSRLISNQQKLIELIYDERKAEASARELKGKIDRDLKILGKRK